MARLCLCLIIFYSSVMLLDSADADSVGPMNELLSYPGWPAFNSNHCDAIRVLDRWTNTEQWFEMRQLLELSPNGQIVTDENVDCKVKMAHRFLSCKYADFMKKYCEYERGIAYQCRRIDSSKSLEYFINALGELIEHNNRLVPRMRGALSFLYDLSPNVVHNEDVSKILEDFTYYYNAKQYEASTSETGSAAVAAQSHAIERHMLNTVELLSAFYNSYCRPIPEDNGVSTARKNVESGKNSNRPTSEQHFWKTEVRRIVDDCIKAHYELLGFKYNSQLSTTGIVYDSDMVPHIYQINHLLSFSGWSEMDTDEIIGNNRRLYTSEVLKKSPDGTILNQKNVGEKLPHVHLMLSCEYVIEMKTCCNHLTGIANECDKTDGVSASLECWRQFWIIVKEIDPMVLHMQGALLYFYSLSSKIEYKKGVYEILGELKNYYDTVVLPENWIAKTAISMRLKTWKTELLTKKFGPLFEFFGKNCWTNPPLSRRTISENSRINRRDVFKEFINRFIDTTYGSFGFAYDPASDETNVMTR